MEQNDKIFSVLEDLEYEEPMHNVNLSNAKSDSDGTNGINLTSLPSKFKKVKRLEPNFVNNLHMKKMGLDSNDDRDFLNELIRFYDFNLILA
jgi:hypothetical protein